MNTSKFQNKTLKLPPLLKKIAKHLAEHNYKTYLVGGVVRDHFFGTPSKDFDLEVFGVEDISILAKALAPLGKVNEVGKAFSVLKLAIDGQVVDLSLPRRDVKVGEGHKGFDVVSDAGLRFEEAAGRRDFTMNAMGIEVLTETLIDPFNGCADIENRCLRHINEAFSEDPLRVLRGMQFAARFDCEIHRDTVALCQNIDLSELPRERLYDEFKKCLLKAKTPSIGFEWADRLGVLRYFPELEALKDTPQDPQWHPEGDVWIHTLLVVDGMAEILDHSLKEGETRNEILMWAALCHDFGKPSTTKFFDDRWHSHGHDEAGIKPTKVFLERLTQEKNIIDAVLPLVKEHMKPLQLFDAAKRNKVSDAAIRRLALRVDMSQLITLSHADFLGTKPDRKDLLHCEISQWLCDRAEKLNLKEEKPTPFLTGQDLLDRGFKPGPKIGKIIRTCFNLQIEGDILSREQALVWLDAYIAR